MVKNEIFSWIKSIVFALVIVFVCRQFLFTPVTVSGESMMPTFEDHNKVIVSKISKIKRFDVVVFKSPESDDNYIKRVIGLPGDTIKVKGDVLYINGRAYEEPYLNQYKEALPIGTHLTDDFTLAEKTGKTQVPEGTIFVMGDNRRNSNDSRMFGFISDKAVMGEVKFRFFPFDEMGNPE
ncbi:signal peptidase I [Bacillus testis]|uniref:signal peptidase I n=1 Tax=Bacillus testis TaxID=1622072 RepID=UPI00067F3DA9|nr:signal peptidase I [Bacillus testis]